MKPIGHRRKNKLSIKPMKIYSQGQTTTQIPKHLINRSIRINPENISKKPDLIWLDDRSR